MSLTPEQIEENFKKFRSLCEKLKDRSKAVLAMVDAIDERLALCPASAKRDFHCAYPGGLVIHSLHVLENVITLNGAFAWDLPKDSMILASLMHDIGKLGTPTEDFYVQQTDSWRLEKLGECYKYNDAIPYMSTPDRSLFLCQHFGVKLNHDESLAIKLNDGFVVEDNKKYCLKTPKLAFAVMTADYIATMEEKDLF